LEVTGETMKSSGTKLSAAQLVRGVALLTLLLPMWLWAEAPDPAIGTWELNLAKSQFEPGPPPKSQVRTYEVPPQMTQPRVRAVDAEGKAKIVTYPTPPAAEVVRMTAKGVDADGKATLTEYTAGYDGKDYLFTGNPNADTISLKRIDDLTVEATTKKAGEIVSSGTRAVSKDGAVMTITLKGTNAKGERVNNTLVFDRR
jgi:hypothetical protein